MNLTLSGISSPYNRYSQNLSDPVSFERKDRPSSHKKVAVKSPSIPSRITSYTPVAYNTVLSKPLPSYKKQDLEKILVQVRDVQKPRLAAQRVQSFSNYLKKMVGFIPPAAVDNKQWFELGCTYLIKGAAGVNVPEEAYPRYAKKLWNLISKADPYWTSDEFINYLQTINNNKGVQATIDALKELKPDSKNLWGLVSFTGNYVSDMRYIPELLKNGCAYSGTPLDPTKYNKYPTLEHIFPHAEGTDLVNTDYNYVLTLGLENSSRGCIPLVEFLGGWNEEDFIKAKPYWKQQLIASLKQQYNLTDSDFIPKSAYKSILDQPLKANPNPDLISSLANDRNVIDPTLAVKRINSLSRYLKEEMVGFIQPNGQQWFEEASTNLIKATAGADLPECMYEEYARNFWGLMAKADNYWTSTEFIQYLESINTNAGVNTTIKVIQDLKMFKEISSLQKRKIAFTGKYDFAIPDKILNDGCAYTNRPFVTTDPEFEPAWKPLLNPFLNKDDESLEKLSNFVLTTKSGALERSDLPLALYLRGWNEVDCRTENKQWRKKMLYELQEKYESILKTLTNDFQSDSYIETNTRWRPIYDKIMRRNTRAQNP